LTLKKTIQIKYTQEHKRFITHFGQFVPTPSILERLADILLFKLMIANYNLKLNIYFTRLPLVYFALLHLLCSQFHHYILLCSCDCQCVILCFIKSKM